jgi:hypothetical protein
LVNEYLSLHYQASTPEIVNCGEIEVLSQDTFRGILGAITEVYCFYSIKEVRAPNAEIFQASVFKEPYLTYPLVEMTDAVYRKMSNLTYIHRALELANKGRMRYKFDGSTADPLSRKALHHRVNKSREQMAYENTLEEPIVVKFVTAKGEMAGIHVCFESQLNSLMAHLSKQPDKLSFEKVSHQRLESYHHDKIADTDPGIPVYAHPFDSDRKSPQALRASIWNEPSTYHTELSSLRDTDNGGKSTADPVIMTRAPERPAPIVHLMPMGQPGNSATPVASVKVTVSLEAATVRSRAVTNMPAGSDKQPMGTPPNETPTNKSYSEKGGDEPGTDTPYEEIQHEDLLSNSKDTTVPLMCSHAEAHIYSALVHPDSLLLKPGGVPSTPWMASSSQPCFHYGKAGSCREQTLASTRWSPRTLRGLRLL